MAFMGFHGFFIVGGARLLYSVLGRVFPLVSPVTLVPVLLAAGTPPLLTAAGAPFFVSVPSLIYLITLWPVFLR